MKNSALSNNVCQSSGNIASNTYTVNSTTNTITVTGTGATLGSGLAGQSLTYGGGTGNWILGGTTSIGGGLAWDPSYQPIASWPTAPSYYDPKSLIDKAIDRSYVKTLIEAKNYNHMCYVADVIVKNDRKSFAALEKAILASKDFEVIGNYIKSVNTISVHHLTSKFLDAYRLCDKERKAEKMMYVAYEARNKLDINKCYSYARKYKDPNFIQWIMSNPYCRDIDTQLAENDISIKKLNNIIDMSNDSNLLFNLAHISKLADKEKIFRRIRKLGNLDLASKLVHDSNEEWAKKLTHLK